MSTVYTSITYTLISRLLTPSQIQKI